MMRSDQAAGLRATSRVPGPIHNGGYGSQCVIAVTSGKGGVGKTQIAANLAVSLAQRGRKVLLVDADLGLASLDLALGIRPFRNLLHVLDGECTVAEAISEGPCGVALLPACPGRYSMANLDLRGRGVLFDAIDQVRSDYDVLVIDTGAGLGSNAVAFAAQASELLLVATPDPTSIRDAYAMAKVLNRRTGVYRMSLIANQVGSEREGIELHDRIDSIVRRFLSLELGYVGAIPRDPLVQDAVRTGEPFVLRSPRGAAARATESIAMRLDSTTTSLEVS